MYDDAASVVTSRAGIRRNDGVNCGRRTRESIAKSWIQLKQAFVLVAMSNCEGKWL